MSEIKPFDGYKNGSTAIPWVAVLIAAAGFVWSIANPRDDIKQTRLELRDEFKDALNQAKVSIHEKLPRLEHEEFSRRVDRDNLVVRDEINRIRTDLVGRSEHILHWADTDDRIKNVRELIVDLRKDFVTISPPGDQFKNIQDQIKSLRENYQQLLAIVYARRNNEYNSTNSPNSTPPKAD